MAQSYPHAGRFKPSCRPVVDLLSRSMDESFALAIQDHLDLQRRNRLLEPELPLSSYRDPRHVPTLEDTQEWVMPDTPAKLEHDVEPLFPPADELWSGTPAFDWGD